MEAGLEYSEPLGRTRSPKSGSQHKIVHHTQRSEVRWALGQILTRWISEEHCGIP